MPRHKIPAHVRKQQINNLPNISFIRWCGPYTGCDTKATVRCAIDGFEWPARVQNLLNRGNKCPQCSGKRRWSAEERIAQINALPNITFVRWLDAYKDNYSKAVCRCDKCHEWAADVRSLVNGGHGCPGCAKTGYDRTKIGTLYVLRSECGAVVKIGVSNAYKRRHSNLKYATPFAWVCIELLHGDGAAIAEFEKELHSFTTPATFDTHFNGYTEWRNWDPRLPQWIKRHRTRLARIVAP